MFVSSSILRSRVHKSNAGLFSLSIAFYLPPQIYSSLARRPRLRYVAPGKKKTKPNGLTFSFPLFVAYLRTDLSVFGGCPRMQHKLCTLSRDTITCIS